MKTSNDPISVGDKIEKPNARWSFADGVADTFSEHIRRSIPCYEMGQDLICNLSDFFSHEDSICYEIGVSVGDLIGKLARHTEGKGTKWVGIDSEPSMIEMATANLSGVSNVALEVADANLYEFEKSDLIVSYYCVQFVPPKLRQELINKIYASLNWGGAFVWFEKVRGADARFHDIFTSMYTDFKLEQGITAEEIVAKSRSLKGVLEPFSTNGNLDLLKRAGFVDVTTVMKFICFEGFLAIK